MRKNREAMERPGDALSAFFLLQFSHLGAKNLMLLFLCIFQVLNFNPIALRSRLWCEVGAFCSLGGRSSSLVTSPPVFQLRRSCGGSASWCPKTCRRRCDSRPHRCPSWGSQGMNRPTTKKVQPPQFGFKESVCGGVGPGHALCP